MSCVCNLWEVTAEGGMVAGGAVTESTTANTVTGGIAAGGTADVGTNTMWDAMLVYHLHDDLSDSGPFGLHGTSSYPPTADDGVGCAGSMLLDGTQYVELPADSFGDEVLTVSCFAKVNSLGVTRAFYSRGDGLQFGHNYFSDAWSRVIDTDGNEYIASGTEQRNDDWWYHYAVVKNKNTLTVYVNGEEADSYDLDGAEMPEATSGAIGRAASGMLAEANVQELRVYAGERSEDWFKMERRSICGGLVTAGDTEIPVLS